MWQKAVGRFPARRRPGETPGRIPCAQEVEAGAERRPTTGAPLPTAPVLAPSVVRKTWRAQAMDVQQLHGLDGTTPRPGLAIPPRFGLGLGVATAPASEGAAPTTTPSLLPRVTHVPTR